MSRRDRWAALGLTRPDGWGKPGSTAPIDLLMFAATCGASPTDDPIRAMLETVEDELATLAAALVEDTAVNGYAGTARALAFRVRAARLLLERADEVAADERPFPDAPGRGADR